MSFSNTSPSCILDPDQPKCGTANLLKELADNLNHLSGKIAEENQISKEPKSHEPMALGIRNRDTRNESFSDFDTVIKEKSSHLSEIIVDLIMNHQVGDKPERIRGIRLKISRFVKDLKAMEIADIKPEIKKEISDQMKASMSAILEEILTH
jgi:hypothetical protein